MIRARRFKMTEMSYLAYTEFPTSYPTPPLPLLHDHHPAWPGDQMTTDHTDYTLHTTHYTANVNIMEVHATPHWPVARFRDLHGQLSTRLRPRGYTVNQIAIEWDKSLSYVSGDVRFMSKGSRIEHMWDFSMSDFRKFSSPKTDMKSPWFVKFGIILGQFRT